MSHSNRGELETNSAFIGQRNTFVEEGIPFLEDEHVNGISLLRDDDLVNDLLTRLSDYAHAQPKFRKFMPVNWPYPLRQRNIYMFNSYGPYVVSPKPEGVRYLLYIDSMGRMFMENHTRNIFKLDQDVAPHLSVKDTLLDGIVVRNIIEDKLTFVIMDAIRCNGVDLTRKSIQDRISTVRMEVMEPRLIGTENGSISTEREVFQLDITNYSDAADFENYFTEEFKALYEYPLHSFIFQPRNMSYICGNFGKNIEWTENENKPKFNFRLKISSESNSSGDLLYWKGVNFPNEDEVKYATIPLTPELRRLDGYIIECHNVDSQWVFVRPRKDRVNPNGLKAIEGKLDENEEIPVTLEQLLAYLKRG